MRVVAQERSGLPPPPVTGGIVTAGTVTRTELDPNLAASLLDHVRCGEHQPTLGIAGNEGSAAAVRNAGLRKIFASHPHDGTMIIGQRRLAGRGPGTTSRLAGRRPGGREFRAGSAWAILAAGNRGGAKSDRQPEQNQPAMRGRLQAHWRAGESRSLAWHRMIDRFDWHQSTCAKK